jgi:2-amino-4-hydroxy-6-hydroxymethyldihydropteridine diphosphokinase
MNNTVYLLLGSKLGDRQQNLMYAKQEISREIGPIITGSAIYKTAAWGNVKQPDFYNQVIQVKCGLNPQELLTKILEIEKGAGRERKERWGARTLDIDILFYEDLIMESESLKIPHPEIQNRKFTLLPLAEIAGEFIHPITKKTISQLLAESRDNLSVEKI